MDNNSTPPVKIGDKVHYMRFDENNVVTFHPYIVCGVAFLNGKWYAIDGDRGFNPVGTRWCIVGYNGTEVQ